MAQIDRTRELLGEFLPDALAIEVREPARSRRVTLYALLALVITAILWASLSSIDKLVAARGRLVTPLPNLVVQPLEPGILKSIEVRLGQVVKKGAVLAVLDPTFAAADASQLGSRSNTLSLQARRLEHELQGRPAPNGVDQLGQEKIQADLQTERQAAFEARLHQYDQTIERMKASLETNRRDAETLSSRVKTLEELETMHADLIARNFSSRSRMLEVREKRLEVERDHVLTVNREREILSEIAAHQAERLAFSKAWRQDAMEKLSTTLQQRDEINDQLTKARLRSELVTLTAPHDAIVLEIGPKSAGSIVREAESLFVLVPLDAELEAEIEIATADIGEIRVGDPVRLKLDAYPFQKHGTVKGKVSSVSADTFTRETSFGRSSHYLARVNLEDTRLSHVPEPTVLLPGMTLSGEIITGQRSVISYFVYPVIRVFDESLRER